MRKKGYTLGLCQTSRRKVENKRKSKIRPISTRVRTHPKAVSGEIC
ncbi:hypothetical protein MmTuc01_3232 [Methanosarcina mazei Tuc01]|uniref:Uncharacterized protein n=1 Tax=Methanosarcina mazei Tuc01 TaxID=1236903 RepID=M1QNA8_METMZ|nr:hypothetical protein MmTuc01_3232 [Methanosarcina mazei Tuc01]